jgi:septin family protein
MAIKSIMIDGMSNSLNGAYRSWDPIVKYIKDQHSAYLRKELTANRDRYIQDTRIHCCLFFIQPSGHAYLLVPSVLTLV